MNKTVLELQKGKVNINGGTFVGNMVVHCEADGDIEITWDDLSVTTYGMVAGDDREIRNSQMKQVSIANGYFTIMNY